jgi:hypothetical protein
MAPVSIKTIHFIVATSILLPLSIVAIVLRVVASRKRGRSFKSHDYLAFGCFVRGHVFAIMKYSSDSLRQV